MNQPMPSSPQGEFQLHALTGEPSGLSVFAQPSRTDGTFATDSRGRPTVRKVHLKPATPPPRQRPNGLVTDREWTWLASAKRRWDTVVKQLGDATRAWEVCAALAAAGCGVLQCAFARGAVQHPPQWWIPDPALAARQRSTAAGRRDRRNTLETEAAALSEQLTDTWPGAAASLGRPLGGAQLLWVVRAARDLAGEVSHDGIRAFVQAHHPADDKAREDLPLLLRDNGWEEEALRKLGVDRSPYIGVGGPIKANFGTRELDWTGWPGPHDIRLPHDAEIELRCDQGTEQMAVIENRQAAETICDLYPEMPVIWCRGHHSDRVLAAIAQAAANCQRVLICTDADLGGLRIAERLFERLHSITTTVILDVGEREHEPGRAFSVQVLEQLARYRTSPAPIRDFAAALEHRGHAVTQEALVKRTLQAAMRRPHLSDTPA
ncbi:DUF2399 domain-containing protein [Glycomyces sp. NPDC047010]|uniref:DUF2399 domain-containing protein n=1 Tax=Glycomyces sp. NPDC047010 TaxID=3155023 RepID=UPI0033C28475